MISKSIYVQQNNKNMVSKSKNMFSKNRKNMVSKITKIWSADQKKMVSKSKYVH